MLALHVVRAGGDWPERRAADDVFGVAAADEVGEVGAPAAELGERHGRVRLEQVLAQERLDSRGVEALVVAHLDQFGVAEHVAHCAVTPPSITISAPVTNAESSDIR